MATVDARIAIGLPSHPKTKKLIRRIGEGGAWRLVCLFLWTAANRPNGDLSGMTDEDIELAIDWSGEPGAFIAAMIGVRFLDGEEGNRSIHDWAEHNPWAATASLRSEAGKKGAATRWQKKGWGDAGAMANASEPMANACGSHTDSNAVANGKTCDGMAELQNRNAPTPTPTPTPTPKEKEQKKESGDASAPPVGQSPALTLVGTNDPEAKPRKPRAKNPAFDAAIGILGEPALVAKKIRECGADTVQWAVGETLSQGPADPKSYLLRLLTPDPSRVGNTDRQGFKLDAFGRRTGERGVVV